MIADNILKRLVLVPLLAIATVPAAHATSFDLECAQLYENGEPAFNAPTAHYQIDMETGRWCAAKCEKTETIVRRQGTTITLKDSLYHGDPMMVEYHEDTGRLVDGFAIGTEFERIWNYICVKGDFGNFAPYLAEPVQPRGRFVVSNADLFDDPANTGPSGWVGFEVTVDPTGLLLDCIVPLSSGNAELDRRVCTLVMERLRVLPARDRAGQPVAGKYRNRIRWIGDD